MINIGQDRLGPDGDAFYEQLIAAHHGLPPDESSRLNARLVLLMANAIADPDTLKAILDRASAK